MTVKYKDIANRIDKDELIDYYKTAAGEIPNTDAQSFLSCFALTPYGTGIIKSLRLQRGDPDILSFPSPWARFSARAQRATLLAAPRPSYYCRRSSWER